MLSPGVSHVGTNHEKTVGAGTDVRDSQKREHCIEKVGRRVINRVNVVDGVPAGCSLPGGFLARRIFDPERTRLISRSLEL
jgi:hypothetical protein